MTALTGQVCFAAQVSEEEFLQRYAVTAASGEEMVVTFRMQLEDSLVFLRWGSAFLCVVWWSGVGWGGWDVGWRCDVR